MNAFLAETGVFLVQLVFGLYLLAVLLRLLLQIVRADFYNPLAQFVVALTNPVLRPLRRLIPGFYGIDVASILLLLVLQTLELLLVGTLIGRTAPLPILVYTAVIELLVFTLYVFIFAIVIRAVLSWFVPHGGYQNPAMGILISLTEPLLRPARRRLPLLSGIDLSPLVVLAVLWIAVSAVRHFLAIPPWWR